MHLTPPSDATQRDSPCTAGGFRATSTSRGRRPSSTGKWGGGVCSARIWSIPGDRLTSDDDATVLHRLRIYASKKTRTLSRFAEAASRYSLWDGDLWPREGARQTRASIVASNGSRARRRRGEVIKEHAEGVYADEVQQALREWRGTACTACPNL